MSWVSTTTTAVAIKFEGRYHSALAVKGPVAGTCMTAAAPALDHGKGLRSMYKCFARAAHKELTGLTRFWVSSCNGAELLLLDCCPSWGSEESDCDDRQLVALTSVLRI